MILNVIYDTTDKTLVFSCLNYIQGTDQHELTNRISRDLMTIHFILVVDRCLDDSILPKLVTTWMMPSIFKAVRTT